MLIIYAIYAAVLVNM